MTDTPTIYTNPQTLAAAVVELLENKWIGNGSQPRRRGRILTSRKAQKTAYEAYF